MFGFRIFGKTDLNLFDFILLFLIFPFLVFGYVGLVFAIDTGRAIDFLLSLGCFSIAGAIHYGRKQQVLKQMRVEAGNREAALDYDAAIEIWEELGEIEEAGRVRKLKVEQGAVKLSQTVVQGDHITAQKVVRGDEITKTEIKDSVISKSSIGASGKSKAEHIKEIKELLDSGAIDTAEFQQMKKEILED